MMLEANEQTELGNSSRGADQSGDGVITFEELVSHVSPKSDAAASTGFGTQSSTSSTPVGSRENREDRAESRRGDSTDKEQSARVRKSFRFRSTKERQPSWRFDGKDSDGDGQVSMSEYSRSWTDRTAAEFRRYDRDNDGMISPAEVR